MRENNMFHSARMLLEQHDLHLVDTPYDGSCVAWAVMPAISASMGRPTTAYEVRQLLVDAMYHPSLRAEIEKDLRQTNKPIYETDGQFVEYAPDRTYDDFEALLRSFRENATYIPPVIVARAVELVTGGSVQLLSSDTHRIFTLYESDAGAPYTLRFFHEPSINHTVLLKPLPPAVAAAALVALGGTAAVAPVEPASVLGKRRVVDDGWAPARKPMRLVASPLSS